MKPKTLSVVLLIVLIFVGGCIDENGVVTTTTSTVLESTTTTFTTTPTPETSTIHQPSTTTTTSTPSETTTTLTTTTTENTSSTTTITSSNLTTTTSETTTSSTTATTTPETTTTLPAFDKDNLRIASWNVQIFGKSKYNKPDVRKAIIDELKDYDIIAFQEIRDSSQSYFPKLMEELPAYDYVVSARLGRTSSKEQYAFIYRKEIELVESHVFTDSEDVFEREPFIATFKIDNRTFDIVQIHTKPDDAENEIDELLKIRTSTNQIWLGDFNADCSYYDETQEEPYNWIIPDSEDTTVKSTNCTYDRIVVTDELAQAVRGYHVNKLTEYNYTFQIEISDHYPVSIFLNVSAVGIASNVTNTTGSTAADNNTSTNTTNTTVSYNIKITAVQFDTPHNPENEHLNEEWVEITNYGNDTDMSGWILYDEGYKHKYVFHSFTLGANKSVKVHTGIGSDTETDLYMNRQSAIWNNDGDIATLVNDKGEIMDYKSG